LEDAQHTGDFLSGGGLVWLAAMLTRLWGAHKIDDFVNSPSSALRFTSLSLRRTASTPRDTRFARLDLASLRSHLIGDWLRFHQNVSGQKLKKNAADETGGVFFNGQ
jgi:hypothetical protein